MTDGGGTLPFNGGRPSFFFGFAPAFGGSAAANVGLRVEKVELGVEAERGGEENLESGEEDRLDLGLVEAMDTSRSLEGIFEWEREGVRGRTYRCILSRHLR